MSGKQRRRLERKGRLMPVLRDEQREQQQNQPAKPQTMTTHLSTGPRTPEGKAVSSQNALSHGLTSAKLVLPWENEADFNSMLSGLVAEHQPATVTEEILVRELAENYWRLQRARNQEYKLMARPEEIFERDGSVSETYRDWLKQLALAQRYITRHERGFHKCLTTLRTLQKERREREAEAAADAEQASLNEPTRAPSTTYPSTQFVSQNDVVEEILLSQFPTETRP